MKIRKILSLAFLAVMSVFSLTSCDIEGLKNNSEKTQDTDNEQDYKVTLYINQTKIDINKTGNEVLDLTSFEGNQEGYEFKGWYIDENFTVEYTSNTVNETIVLYAKMVKSNTNQEDLPALDEEIGTTDTEYEKEVYETSTEMLAKYTSIANLSLNSDIVYDYAIYNESVDSKQNKQILNNQAIGEELTEQDTNFTVRDLENVFANNLTKNNNSEIQYVVSKVDNPGKDKYVIDYKIVSKSKGFVIDSVSLQMTINTKTKHFTITEQNDKSKGIVCKPSSTSKDIFETKIQQKVNQKYEILYDVFTVLDTVEHEMKSILTSDEFLSIKMNVSNGDEIACGAIYFSLSDFYFYTSSGSHSGSCYSDYNKVLTLKDSEDHIDMPTASDLKSIQNGFSSITRMKLFSELKNMLTEAMKNNVDLSEVIDYDLSKCITMSNEGENIIIDFKIEEADIDFKLISNLSKGIEIELVQEEIPLLEIELAYDCSDDETLNQLINDYSTKETVIYSEFVEDADAEIKDFKDTTLSLEEDEIVKITYPTETGDFITIYYDGEKLLKYEVITNNDNNEYFIYYYDDTFSYSYNMITGEKSEINTINYDSYLNPYKIIELAIEETDMYLDKSTAIVQKTWLSNSKLLEDCEIKASIKGKYNNQNGVFLLTYEDGIYTFKPTTVSIDEIGLIDSSFEELIKSMFMGNEEFDIEFWSYTFEVIEKDSLYNRLVEEMENILPKYIQKQEFEQPDFKTNEDYNLNTFNYACVSDIQGGYGLIEAQLNNGLLYRNNIVISSENYKLDFSIIGHDNGSTSSVISKMWNDSEYETYATLSCEGAFSFKINSFEVDGKEILNSKSSTSQTTTLKYDIAYQNTSDVIVQKTALSLTGLFKYDEDFTIHFEMVDVRNEKSKTVEYKIDVNGYDSEKSNPINLSIIGSLAEETDSLITVTISEKNADIKYRDSESCEVTANSELNYYTKED